MRILFLSRRFYPDIGGVEKHVLEIGRRLVQKGHTVIVITESLGKQTRIEGIEIKRMENIPNNWLKKFYIWKWMLGNFSLFQQADVVHAHDVYFWYFPFRFLFPFKKSFVTFHGYETYPILKRAIFVRKLSEKLSNGNIIVGKFIKKWYGTKPDYITYGAVEISNFPACQSLALVGRQFPRLPKLGTGGQAISNKIKQESAIFIGRLDEQTGILEYAKAVSLIRKDSPAFDFAIIGDGNYKKRLERYKPLGFKENSIDYLKKYNFAFVSRYLSILEALASKRLVFALYDNPVKEDYLKLTPFAKFIIIENSAENLVKKVQYYLRNNDKVQDKINSGYKWARKQTWENVVYVYLRLWKASYNR